MKSENWSFIPMLVAVISCFSLLCSLITVRNRAINAEKALKNQPICECSKKINNQIDKIVITFNN